MKLTSIHLLVQLGVLIAIGAMAGFFALLAMGGIGGTAMGVAPEYSFGRVKGIVCPEGTLEYFSVERSYHQPGESEPHLECVDQDGSREDVLIPAILSVLVGTFLVVFLIIFLPGFILGSATAFFLARKVLSAGPTEDTNPPAK